MIEVLFGVVNYIMCWFNKTSGRTVNIKIIGGLNCVGCLFRTEFTVDGGYYVGMRLFANNL